MAQYDTIYENILSAIQSITPKILDAQRIINGLYVDLYEPLPSPNNESVFCDDARTTYPDTPTSSKEKLLIVGLHQKIYHTYSGYDVYLEEGAKIFTLESDLIPRFWKVVVYLGQRTYIFKVDHHQVIAGVEEPVIVENICIPWS